jgi:hypothetical protein
MLPMIPTTGRRATGAAPARRRGASAVIVGVVRVSVIVMVQS